MEKEIDNLENKNFDKYGFAKEPLSRLDDENYVLKFHAKNPKDNIVNVKNGKLITKSTISFISPFYFLTKDDIESMDIVDTIKHLLLTDKENSFMVLREMPLCLYEDKEVSEDIFSCIPKEKAVNEVCKREINRKMDIIKAAKQIEKQNQNSSENFGRCL